MSSLPDFDTLWDYDDPAGTETRFRALLPEVEASGSVAKRVELLTQIARTRGLQKDFVGAHKLLDSLEDALGDAGPRATVRFLLERGRAFNSSGDSEAARPLFERAWEIGKAAGEDRLAIDAAHMAAIVGSPNEALAWTEMALDLVEKTTDESAKHWKGALYNNVGWTYHENGRFLEALDAFEKGLEFRLERGATKPIRIAKYAVARVLRSLGRIDEAMAILEPVRAEWLKDGIEPPYVNEEIGECLILLPTGTDDPAPYFARAYASLSQDSWLVENEPARIARLRLLAGIPE